MNEDGSMSAISALDSRTNGFQRPFSTQVLITATFALIEAITYLVVIVPFAFENSSASVRWPLIIIWIMVYMILLF